MYIIAEVGVNHDGYLDKAINLITAAKECGCDAVKFQSFYADRLVHPSAKKVDYQLRSGDESESHYEMIRKLEFNGTNFKKAFEYASKINIDFITTPYDPFSAKEAYDCGVRKFKTASADLSDLYLHNKISSFKDVEVIIATGMSDIKTIKNTISIYKNTKPTILHCVSEYPCSDGSLNLNCINLLKKNFKNHKIGFSDHSIDNVPSLIAASIGYEYFERHFTLNKKDEGPDHYASSDVNEMKNYVQQIRRCKRIKGLQIKNIQREEMGMSNRSKKAILSKVNLKKGTKINLDNTYAIRPSENGISIDKLQEIIGKELVSDVPKNSFIQYSDLK